MRLYYSLKVFAALRGEAERVVKGHSALGFERNRAGISIFAQQLNAAGHVDAALPERDAAAVRGEVLRVEVDDARDDAAQRRDFD